MNIIRFVQLILRYFLLIVDLYSVLASLPGISHCLVWFLPKIIELLIELKNLGG